jgi:hypothetical protein
VPTAVAGIPSTEILTSIAGAGPNNCGSWLKVFIYYLHMVVRLAYLLELQTLTMFVLPPNGTTSVVGYAAAQAPTFFLYGLVTMMF